MHLHRQVARSCTSRWRTFASNRHVQTLVCCVCLVLFVVLCVCCHMFVVCWFLLVVPTSGKQLHTRRVKKLFLCSRATTHPHVIYLFVVACLLIVCVVGRGGEKLHQQVAKRCTSRWRKVAPAGGEKLHQQVANSCTNRWRNVALNRVCKCKSTLFSHC